MVTLHWTFPSKYLDPKPHADTDMTTLSLVCPIIGCNNGLKHVHWRWGRSSQVPQLTRGSGNLTWGEATLAPNSLRQLFASQVRVALSWRWLLVLWHDVQVRGNFPVLRHPPGITWYLVAREGVAMCQDLPETDFNQSNSDLTQKHTDCTDQPTRFVQVIALDSWQPVEGAKPPIVWSIHRDWPARKQGEIQAEVLKEILATETGEIRGGLFQSKCGWGDFFQLQLLPQVLFPSSG